MSNRPRLKSHARPLRRGPGSLQLGLYPGEGVVLDGLSEAEIVMAEGLDGSVDTPALYAAAAAAGVTADRVSALIETLNEHHLLVDTVTDRALRSTVRAQRLRPLRPDATAKALSAAYGLPGDGFDRIAARTLQHVVISGEGDLPCALAHLLRAGGIGRVSVGAQAANVLDLELKGQRSGAGQAAFGQAPDPLVRPDLVVLTAMGALHADTGEPWLRRGIPHLPLVVQAHRVHVGRLITGGAGPCLSCMDLHRRDRDRAWPAVLSQLSPVWPLRPDAPINVESTLSAMTTGVAAMIVHTYLDGQPVSDDVSLELSLPWPAILSRRWFRHSLCQCTAEQRTMTR